MTSFINYALISLYHDKHNVTGHEISWGNDQSKFSQISFQQKCITWCRKWPMKISVASKCTDKIWKSFSMNTDTNQEKENRHKIHVSALSEVTTEDPRHGIDEHTLSRILCVIPQNKCTSRGGKFFCAECVWAWISFYSKNAKLVQDGSYRWHGWESRK